MATMSKEYRRELKKVLLTTDPDKLIEFSKKWAGRADNQRLANLKDLPREYIEMMMHQMTIELSSIPNEIKNESEKWLEEYWKSHANPDDNDPRKARVPFGTLSAEVSRLKINARIYPNYNPEQITHRKHFADLMLPGFPRVCFTKVDRDENGTWLYHLSISSPTGKINNETVQLILIALGAPKQIMETPGKLYGGTIRHFWWPCDDRDVIN